MKKGFTLLEILLVIAAIGILAAIVIVAINPRRQLAQVRNVERESEINAIFSAIQQYAIDNSEYPPGLENYYQDICSTTVTTNCIDLSVLAPTYLASIPEDPQGVAYDVALHPDNGKLSVVAFGSELTDGVKHINGFGLIESWEDLYNVRNELSQTYNLATDLNATTPGYDVYASALANGGLGWDPIGDSSNPFTGRFDGQGFSISSLYINRPTTDDQGLFRRLDRGVDIEDLVLEDFSITCQARCGALAATSYADILRVEVNNATITGGRGANQFNRKGAMVGNLSGGSARHSSVRNSFVNAEWFVGGFASQISQAEIDQVVVENTTTSMSRYGGLLAGVINGNSSGPTQVQNVYVSGKVNGAHPQWGGIGGYAGSIYGDPGTVLVDSSYSVVTLSIPDHSNKGGFVGQSANADILNSFWDVDVAGGWTTSQGGTSKTTSEMTNISTYTDTLTSGLDQAWDFSEVWDINPGINGGYPYLQWEL